jgi:7-cyano-7-deazaguanine synthase
MASDKTVVLLSGGIDSSVLLRKVEATGGGALPLFVDYGQRAVAHERAAALAQCQALGLELKELDVSSVKGALYASCQRLPHSPLPHRNLVLVSLALSYAEGVGAGAVAAAVIRDDLGAYGCTLGSFWYAFRDLAASIGTTQVETPFIDLDKVSVMREGDELGLNLATTYSCTVGSEQHCGRCRQCAQRRTSAARAGLVEPVGFYTHDTLLEQPGLRSLPPRAPNVSASGAWRW